MYATGIPLAKVATTIPQPTDPLCQATATETPATSTAGVSASVTIRASRWATGEGVRPVELLGVAGVIGGGVLVMSNYLHGRLGEQRCAVCRAAPRWHCLGDGRDGSPVGPSDTTSAYRPSAIN